MILHILSKIFIMFCLIAAGAALDRFRVVSREALQSLSKVVIDVMMPALIFSAIVTQLNRSAIVEGYALPFTGILVFAVGALTGLIFTKLLKVEDRTRKNTFVYLLTLNNYGYLALPLVYMLYGDKGAALLFLNNLGCSVVFWTYGIWLLSGGGFSLKSLKPILNPPFVTLLLSLLIPIIGFEKYIPAIVIELCDTLGKGVIPLIMLVIGSTMAEIKLQHVTLDKTMIWFIIARLILIPVVSILILKIIPLPEMYRNIAIIVAVMPAASSTPLFTKLYGGDTLLAARCVLISTVLSALSIPVLLAIFLK